MHRVGAWLDEGVTSLATCDIDLMPTLEDLATLGWETVARILWIRNNSSILLELHCFRRDAIKCGHCSSSSSLIKSNYCGHIASRDSELNFCGSASAIAGTNELSIPLGEIWCPTCKESFYSDRTGIFCELCSKHNHNIDSVRVVTQIKSRIMIEETFGKEIKDYV